VGVIDAQRESRRVTDELAPYWRQYRDLFIARDLSEMMRAIINGMNAVSLRYRRIGTGGAQPAHFEGRSSQRHKR
jgi:hypothetical protein